MLPTTEYRMTRPHHIPLMNRAISVQKQTLGLIGEILSQKVEAHGAMSPESYNTIQIQAMHLARFLAESAACEALVAYSENDLTGEFERQLVVLYTAQTTVRLAEHLHYRYGDYGFSSPAPLEELFELANHLRIHCHNSSWEHLGDLVLERERDFSGTPALDQIHSEFRDMFGKFSDSVIAPLSEQIHRKDDIVPDEVLQQLAELGAFGISIPEEYGGSFVDHTTMIIATEELSRGSLGAGGSVLTRPEICAKALLSGGTEEQKKNWLPKIASGEKMVCVAVTEPDAGSDVAHIRTTARPVEGGYVINGEKTWVTFAGRSEVFCLLARTGSMDSGHRGLSLFLVEKPRDGSDNQYHFHHEQSGGGTVDGKAIPTIGYRGMHSFCVAFENYFVPANNMIGEEGKGFYLQMQGFSGGRIQTAARAVGVMEAAFRAAVDYAKSRIVFGSPLSDFTLTKFKLAQMATRIQASRQLAYLVATRMDSGQSDNSASLVKLLACADAEWVTREAMQLHGGMGYSEEYPVSRYFADARVLSIFEGAEEVLALQVIVKPFLHQFISRNGS